MKVTAGATVAASSSRTRPLGLRRWVKAAWLLVLYAALFGGAVLILWPVLWTASMALKSPAQLNEWPPRLVSWPLHPENFWIAWQAAPFTRYFLNSLLVTCLAVFGTTVSSFVVAYGFARFNGYGRNVLFLLVLSTMMIPPQVTMIPTFILFRYLHWINTFYPLVVPGFFATSGFNVFLLRQFIMGLSRELDEAASIDGASAGQILTAIIVPLCRPALTTIALLSFIWNWTNFMAPLIYLNSPRLWTLPLGLMFFDRQFVPAPNLMIAVSLLITAPLVILFFLGQRAFVRGIHLTGLT
ncbi:MAG: carbohydrate ABC transporter permease [Chloroflexi bacterium]|nr:carbohydrate ABC transporter permease [Chloroflexota bacterium]